MGVAAGEAEVEDAGASVGADEHVVGLEVAVHEAGGVGGREALTGLDVDREDLGPRTRDRARDGGGAVEPLSQGDALHELHRQEHAPGDDADVVDLDDVGVRELGHQLGLAQHP